ncbi:MAG: hypoxanthine phosphoribosyltransferase [Thermodesulfobacteriota bacterium]|nr:hypoxanthine phosphoribosyltransferase [Thermodesulfobacteriota bacterium]
MPLQMVPVLSKADIAKKVRALAEQISKDYAQKEVVAVGILKGSFIFLADLVRELTIPVQIDFVRLASYGSGTASSGSVQLTKEIELDLTHRHVLVVEDIVDSGMTIAYLLDHLRKFRPESVKVCAFIDKTERREVEIPIDYVGHVVDHGFLVGYGLDFDDKYRTLPEIFHLRQ